MKSGNVFIVLILYRQSIAQARIIQNGEERLRVTSNFTVFGTPFYKQHVIMTDETTKQIKRTQKQQCDGSFPESRSRNV